MIEVSGGGQEELTLDFGVGVNEFAAKSFL